MPKNPYRPRQRVHPPTSAQLRDQLKVVYLERIATALDDIATALSLQALKLTLQTDK